MYLFVVLSTFNAKGWTDISKKATIHQLQKVEIHLYAKQKLKNEIKATANLLTYQRCK